MPSRRATAPCSTCDGVNPLMHEPASQTPTFISLPFRGRKEPAERASVRATQCACRLLALIPLFDRAPGIPPSRPHFGQPASCRVSGLDRSGAQEDHIMATWGLLHE